MTAPVTSRQIQDGIVETSFTMPRSWSLDTLPTPNNKNVLLSTLPSSLRAVWTFDGYATQKRVEKQWEKFQIELEQEKIDRE